MPEFALETDPSKQIEYISEKLGSESVTVTLKISNPTAKPIVWKVKCSSNILFQICTPVGKLESQKSAEVRLIYNANKVIPEDGKHYFVIYYITSKDDAAAKKSGREQWLEHSGEPEGSLHLYVNFKKQALWQKLELGCDDPESRNLLRTFCLQVMQTDIEGLKKEYKKLVGKTIEKPPITAQIANKENGKNRYENVCCIDTTRVVLKWPANGSNYIHANWIDYLGKKDFICTQGPTVDSIDDFWRMVWQEKCRAIVMLCEIIEKGERKCEPYWPREKDGTISTKVGLKIKNLGIEQHEEAVLTVAKLQISSDSGGDPLEVTHFKWNNWPDHGVPSNMLAPFLLLKQLQDKTPAVVHCSAGIGRTGTIVAIGMAMQTINAKESLNMATVVKALRSKRHGTVQTVQQYLYIHRSFLEYAKTTSIVTAEEIEPFCTRYDVFMQSRV